MGPLRNQQKHQFLRLVQEGVKLDYEGLDKLNYAERSRVPFRESKHKNALHTRGCGRQAIHQVPQGLTTIFAGWSQRSCRSSVPVRQSETWQASKMRKFYSADLGFVKPCQSS